MHFAEKLSWHYGQYEMKLNFWYMNPPPHRHFMWLIDLLCISFCIYIFKSITIDHIHIRDHFVLILEMRWKMSSLSVQCNGWHLALIRLCKTSNNLKQMMKEGKTICTWSTARNTDIFGLDEFKVSTLQKVVCPVLRSSSSKPLLSFLTAYYSYRSAI